MSNAAKTVQVILTSGTTTNYINVKARDWKRKGMVNEGQCRKGHNVAVTPGKRIRVWGSEVRTVYTKGDGGRAETVKYDTTFKIGDTAVYDSFNLTYLGKIVSIGAKAVTIVAYQGTCSEKKTRLDLEQFSRFNDFFDLAKINKYNDEEAQCH